MSSSETCAKCGKPWDGFHDAERTLMKVLTDKSILGLITGPKGQGKTFFSVWLAWALVNFPHIDWHVISNIVFGKFLGMKNNQPQDDPESIPWLERADPPSSKIHMATTYAELFRTVSEIMLAAENAGRRKHILFIQDEAPVGGSGSKKMGKEKDVRKETMNALMTLARKMHMSVIMICLHEMMVDTWYRQDPDKGGVGLVRVVFSKWENDIREVAEQSRREYAQGLREYAYDISDIPVGQLVAVKIIDDKSFLPSLLRVYPSTVAKPVPLLKVGDINYDSLGIADWQQGDIGGKKFTFGDIQDRVSDKVANDIPQIMYDYFHGEQSLPPEEKKAAEDAGEMVTGEQFTQLEKQHELDMAEPVKAKRAAPKLIELQRHINMDREVMELTGSPKYKLLADLYEAAGLSRSRFDQFRDAKRVDLSYREPLKTEKVEEDEDDEDEDANIV